MNQLAKLKRSNIELRRHFDQLSDLHSCLLDHLTHLIHLPFMQPHFPDHLQLAKQIAHELLTASDHKGPVECTRMQLMLKRPNGTERDMGGRCKLNMIDVIVEVLAKHAPKPVTANKRRPTAARLKRAAPQPSKAKKEAHALVKDWLDQRPRR